MARIPDTSKCSIDILVVITFTIGTYPSLLVEVTLLPPIATEHSERWLLHVLRRTYGDDHRPESATISSPALAADRLPEASACSMQAHIACAWYCSWWRDTRIRCAHVEQAARLWLGGFCAQAYSS